MRRLTNLTFLGTILRSAVMAWLVVSSLLACYSAARADDYYTYVECHVGDACPTSCAVDCKQPNHCTQNPCECVAGGHGNVCSKM